MKSCELTKLDLGLTPREALILNKLERQEHCSLEELTVLVTKEEGYAIHKSSVNMCVKYLNHKLAGTGYSVVRITKIGRGNKAIYSLVKGKHNKSQQ